MQKIIIDTDCSLGQIGKDVDDGLAIIMALNSSELDLIGITKVYGNTSLNKVGCYLNKLLRTWMESNEEHINFETFNGADIPLHKIMQKSKENKIPQKLKNEILSGKKYPAIKFMADMIEKFPNEVIIVPIGPLTNISLLLSLFPKIIDKIQKLSIMGGKLNGYEFNFANDPIAVNNIAEIEVSKDVCGLEVCQAQKITLDHIEKIKRKNTKLTNYIYEPLLKWYKINKILTRSSNNEVGFYPFDNCAIFNILYPNLIKKKEVRISHSIPRFLKSPLNPFQKTIVIEELKKDIKMESDNDLTIHTNFNWGYEINSEKLLKTIINRIH